MAGPLDRVVGMRQALGDGHETSEEEEDLFNFEHLETKATARVSHVLIFKAEPDHPREDVIEPLDCRDVISWPTEWRSMLRANVPRQLTDEERNIPGNIIIRNAGAEYEWENVRCFARVHGSKRMGEVKKDIATCVKLYKTILQNLNLPDPRQAYKLLVAGTPDISKDGHRMVLKSSEPLFGLGEGEFSATGYLRIVGRTAHTASELSDAEPGKKAGVGDLFKQINASVKDQLQEQVVAGPSQVVAIKSPPPEFAMQADPMDTAPVVVNIDSSTSASASVEEIEPEDAGGRTRRTNTNLTGQPISARSNDKVTLIALGRRGRGAAGAAGGAGGGGQPPRKPVSYTKQAPEAKVDTGEEDSTDDDQQTPNKRPRRAAAKVVQKRIQAAFANPRSPGSLSSASFAGSDTTYTPSTSATPTSGGTDETVAEKAARLELEAAEAKIQASKKKLLAARMQGDQFRAKRQQDAEEEQRLRDEQMADQLLQQRDDEAIAARDAYMASQMQRQCDPPAAAAAAAEPTPSTSGGSRGKSALTKDASVGLLLQRMADDMAEMRAKVESMERHSQAKRAGHSDEEATKHRSAEELRCLALMPWSSNFEMVTCLSEEERSIAARQYLFRKKFNSNRFFLDFFNLATELPFRMTLQYRSTNRRDLGPGQRGCFHLGQPGYEVLEELETLYVDVWAFHFPGDAMHAVNELNIRKSYNNSIQSIKKDRARFYYRNIIFAHFDRALQDRVTNSARLKALALIWFDQRMSYLCVHGCMPLREDGTLGSNTECDAFVHRWVPVLQQACRDYANDIHQNNTSDYFSVGSPDFPDDNYVLFKETKELAEVVKKCNRSEREVENRSMQICMFAEAVLDIWGPAHHEAKRRHDAGKAMNLQQPAADQLMAAGGPAIPDLAVLQAMVVPAPAQAAAVAGQQKAPAQQPQQGTP